MLERRLGRGPYLLVWGVLCALQGLPFFADLGFDPVTTGVWMGAWQLVKIIPATMRMSDLGRQPDDAVFGTIIPFANIYVFWGILLGKTPSPKRWKKLRARWAGQPSWYASAGPALALMARTAGPGLLVLALLSVPPVWILDQLEASVPTWPSWDADTLSLRMNVVGAVAGFLGLYTLIQMTKRKTATPASWLPSVFFLPTLLLAAALFFMGSRDYATLTPLHVGLVSFATILAWQSVVGGMAVMWWTAAADAAERGDDASLSAVWSRVRSRYLSILPAHAGRVQLVWVGSQVVVPGLFYWVYAAFVVPAGLLEDEPEHPLTTRSGKLTWGMMSRLVKLCVIYVLFVLMAQLLVLVIHGPAVMTGVLFGDLSAVPLGTQLAVEVFGNLALWWVTVVLMRLYRARVAQLAARREAREAARAAADTSQDPTPAAP